LIVRESPPLESLYGNQVLENTASSDAAVTYMLWTVSHLLNVTIVPPNLLLLLSTLLPQIWFPARY